MEAIMPSSITQLASGIAVALAMMASTVIGIRTAEPQSHVEYIAQKHSPTAIPISETYRRLGDHQQLRKLFLVH
jgi:hypothetical protein